MSDMTQAPENPAKNRFGKPYLATLHPLQSDVWQPPNIFAFSNKQEDGYGAMDASTDQRPKDLQQRGVQDEGMGVPNSSTGLGVSMASMLFDAKDANGAPENGAQPHQAFSADLSQHFASLSLQADEARARSGAAGMYDQQPAMGMFAGTHVATAAPRPGHGEEVHLQPQMPMPQHPHIPYFPIYPHMMPPAASDVRYVPVDAAHAGMDGAAYAQQYAGIPAISTPGGLMAIPSMPYVQLMPMIQQPMPPDENSVEGISTITYPPPGPGYPTAARIVPSQMLMNGMIPQGFVWDMYRHPVMAAPHTESFRDKRERRKKVERARELITVQGLSTEALQEVKGNVHKLSKDQAGCRLLQQLLDESNEEITELIFKEAKPHLCELMTDAFGNYLFQKLLETADEDQRTNILETVSTRMLGAALNLHGTRSVQKLVELCSSNKKQVEIIKSALKQNIVRLCTDANGNHVVQRALLHLGPDDNDFIYDAVKQFCVKVSTHRHGCCVMQRCLDSARDDQRTALVQEITNNALPLMQNPYGNYVVQYVLDLCTPEETWGVCAAVVGRVAVLSMQKFSSNVVEKCFEKAPPDIQAAFIAELTRPDVIAQMMEDQFANYVVQRALTSCTHAQGQVIVEAIKPHLQTMRHTSGGRRIINKILKRFPMALQSEILAGAVPGHSPPPVQPVQPTDATTIPANVIHIPMASHVMPTQQAAL